MPHILLLTEQDPQPPLAEQLESMKLNLEDEGFAVSKAYSEAAAQDFLQNYKIDSIICTSSFADCAEKFAKQRRKRVVLIVNGKQDHRQFVHYFNPKYSTIGELEILLQDCCQEIPSTDPDSI